MLSSRTVMMKRNCKSYFQILFINTNSFITFECFYCTLTGERKHFTTQNSFSIFFDRMHQTQKNRNIIFFINRNSIGFGWVTILVVYRYAIQMPLIQLKFLYHFLLMHLHKNGFSLLFNEMVMKFF